MRVQRKSINDGSRVEMVSPEVIRQALDTRVVGRSLIYLDETGSTNDEAKKLAEEGAVEGTTIIAGTQTGGRGRLGREWISPRGGVWMSIVLRPASMRPLQKLTLLAGLSVAKTLKDFYGIDAGLKWPNDVVVGNRKICGILTEGSFQGEAPLFVIVGIGLNANIDLGSLPRKYGAGATSVRKVLRRDAPLNGLIANLLKTMEAHYVLYSRGEDEDLWREYEKLCTSIGSDVRVECGEGEVYEGTARGISPDGGLILKTKKGPHVTVLAGDCIHLEKRTTKNIKGERRKLGH